MRRLLSIIVPLSLLFPAFLQAQVISGPWKGELDFGTAKLTVVFRFEDGKCLMDSPDQGAKDIPANLLYVSSDSVSVSQESMGATFSGKLVDGAIVGRFSQRGLSLPLTLTPGEVVRNRPQTPVEPFPYKTEEVSFRNGDATLAGTITYPEGWNGRKKIPVAIMVTGSGSQNRDEEIYEHKPFLVIADHLARNGIATLRYDDRGFGASTGDAVNATTADLRDDALAGLSLLRSRKEFKKVGIIGHSEGGEIAFMLGADEKVDFLVSLAGPSVQGDSILLLQNMNALRQSGYTMRLTKEYIRAQIKAQNSPWLNYFIDYDPVPDIQNIRCPALVLNGDKDTQVEAAVNIPSIENNLPRNRKGRFASNKSMIKVYPGLNHLFQRCGTGQADEYGKIEETISPEVLADIAGWIKGL